jgi:cytochrome c oxidase subunit 6b
MNQTKHCWQNYVDYHKCVNAKGEEFAPCRQVCTIFEGNETAYPNSLQFLLAYTSLCPSGWTARWDEQRGEFSMCMLPRQL